ncbi:hypothetical protein J14TS2_13240 [Bacillus sp. J14TS2]|nr:hypothetical protein J14TS2_13240 [Bacillus sp. J14TS2]
MKNSLSVKPKRYTGVAIVPFDLKAKQKIVYPSRNIGFAKQFNQDFFSHVAEG